MNMGAAAGEEASTSKLIPMTTFSDKFVCITEYIITLLRQGKQ